jgi:hypothetical protein
MHSFLLLQLSFNILILIGLIVLALGGRGRRKPAAPQVSSKVAAFKPSEEGGDEDRAQSPRSSKRAEVKPAPNATGEAAGAPSLAELIERTEQEELVAEGALRRRLERLRAQAAG